MIIGIDPSINTVGVCFLGDKSVQTMTIRSDPKLKPWEKMDQITQKLDDEVCSFLEDEINASQIIYVGIEWPAEYNWHGDSRGLCRLW